MSERPSADEIERARREWLEADQVWADYAVAAATFALKPAGKEDSQRKYEREQIARMDKEVDRLKAVAEAAQLQFYEIAGLPVPTLDDLIAQQFPTMDSQSQIGDDMVFVGGTTWPFKVRRPNVATRVATRVLNHMKGWRK